MKSPSIDQRLQDLADHLSQDQTLLKNYEDSLRYEDDPKRQARYRREIEQLRESTKHYQQEYHSLQQTVTAQMQTVAQQLQQMEQKLDLVLDGQAVIYQSLSATQQTLLAHYSATEQTLLATIVEQLHESQATMTQQFIEALDRQQLPESDIQEMWAVLENRLPELPPSYAQVTEVLKEPGLDARHKLKVTFPIIPFFVDYEGELELGSGFNLKAAWERLKVNLQKQPVVQQPASHKPIWQVAKEIRQNLSEEDLRQLPTDGAINHDHYIYGTPKIEP